MADVSDRAQLIAVGALVVAVAFVTVGLVLNFVIFSENLATRDTNQELRDVNQDRADAKAGVSRSMRYVNLNERSSVTQLTDGIADEVFALNQQYQRNSALAGSSTSLRLSGLTLGTRLAHTNGSRPFRSAEDESSWTVVERIDPRAEVGPTNRNINNPFYLRQNLSRGDLFNAGPTTTKSDLTLLAYEIQITEIDTDGGILGGPVVNRTWSVFVFSDQANETALLITDHPNETFGVNTETLDQFLNNTCQTDRNQPRLELVKGRFGGQPCGELGFYPEGINTQDESIRVSMAYNRTDTAATQSRGTWEMLVEEDSPDDVNTTGDVAANYNSLGGGSPFSYRALYSSTITFRHASSTTDYKVDQIVLPSRATRANLPGFRPAFDLCTVHDTSSGGAEYTFDWEVSDRDGNLQEVQFFLYDHNDDVRRDSQTISVSGQTAADTGNPVLTDSGRDSSGDNYTARMTVVDTAGNTNTVSVTDESDGTDPVGPTC